MKTAAPSHFPTTHPPFTVPEARIHHPLRSLRTTHDYLAYGEELTDPEFQTNNMKFTGHERDEESNLDYMKARYYTAGFGRFLQVDPFNVAIAFNSAKTKEEKQKVRKMLENPMIWNKYSYCYENPIGYTDPDGRISVAEVVIGAVIVSWAGYKIRQAYERAYKAADKREELKKDVVYAYLHGKKGLQPEDAENATSIMEELNNSILHEASGLMTDLTELGIAGNYGPGMPNFATDPEAAINFLGQVIDELKEKLNMGKTDDKKRAQEEKALQEAQELLEKVKRKQRMEAS